MGIEVDIPVRAVDRDVFHEIDHGVMRNAFAVHNTVGRFCDEKIYREALAMLCRGDGYHVDTEVRVRSSHEDFVKLYYLDLVVNRSVIYELKAVDRWHEKHKAQLMHYLMIANLHYGKLVNFRPASVESLFVTSSMRVEDRKRFSVNKDNWNPGSVVESEFLAIFERLLGNWGARLDLQLYQSALMHFVKKVGGGLEAVDLQMGDALIGAQNICMLCAGVAWHLSAYNEYLEQHKKHLVRLLRCLKLEKILWLNVGKDTLFVQTLTQSSCP